MRFSALTFADVEYDLFTTPLWFDDALEILKKQVELRLRRTLAEEQLELLEQELRIVTQRVNLFEKVKIPESKENIRRINIYIGDQQTNSVGRSKIARRNVNYAKQLWRNCAWLIILGEFSLIEKMQKSLWSASPSERDPPLPRCSAWGVSCGAGNGTCLRGIE